MVTKMILTVTFLYLLFQCEDVHTFSQNKRPNSRMTNIKSSLRTISDYRHVNRDLINYLKCLGSSPSQIPPTTIRQYKIKIRNCVNMARGMEHLRKESKNALRNVLPATARPLFECFSEIKIQSSLKNKNKYDDSKEIGHMMVCLSEGQPERSLRLLTAVEEAKKNCVSRSKEKNQNAKQVKCDNEYKKDKRLFMHTYVEPRFIFRSGDNDEKIDEFGSKAKIILRINQKKKKLNKRTEIKELETEQEDYSHIRDNLVSFLKCIGNDPTQIPPMTTTGDFRSIIIFCLSGDIKAKQLKEDSKAALAKPVPIETEAMFKCFTRLDLKTSDINRKSAEIMKCLNEGDVIGAVKKITGIDVNEHKQKSAAKFATAFHNCILDSIAYKNKDKVSFCMSMYIDDEASFFKYYDGSKHANSTDKTCFNKI